MTATADLILERRRTRRRLAFWRIAAIIAVVVAVIAMLPSGLVRSGPHVAQVDVTGVILGDPDQIDMLDEIGRNTRARALIVRINSPGGTVVASEELYLALRRVAERKPVVAVMQEYAASGGYITALGADHIIARGNTLTGSIGVVSEVPNVAGLMDMLGIDVTRTKSAPLKAEPSFTQAPSPEAVAAQQALISDMFAWFSGLVEDRRALDGDALSAVTDGRAFTGRQALALSLIDRIGGESDARDWLETTHAVDSDLPLRTYEPRRPEDVWPITDVVLGALGVHTPDLSLTGFPRMFAILR